MSRYASAGLSGSARSPRARREEASSRKRSRRSGSRPARARVAAIVLVAAIVTRRAARTVSSVRRRSRVTEGMVQQSSEVASGAGPRPLPDPGVDLALLLRRRALHVLPRDRPHLPPHRARHHQGRALPPRAAAADLHAAVVPRHTLPMALLVAVLLAGGRLAGDLEIIAFKAAGVSVLRLFRPVMLAAVVITAATAVLTLVVNPLANEEFQRQLFRILQTRAVSGLHERVFNGTFGDVIIYVEDVSASQVALRGLLVSDERDQKISRIITAREGRLLTDEANRRLTLRLINGAVNEADVLPAAPPPLPGVDQSPTGGAAAPSRYRYTNFAIYDMSLSVDSPLKSTTSVAKPEKDLGLGALLARIEELSGDAHGRVPYEVELHK